MIRRSHSELKSHLIEVLTFNGHENVIGSHPNTLELTRDKEISKRADCIIGVNSDKACAQLNTALKKHVQNGGFLQFELKVNKETFNFFGRGSKGPYP